MSAIYDIAGTTSDSFSLNGKTTLLQGNEPPKPHQGVNGDYYFQSDGSLWAKRADVWLNLTTTSLPNAAEGKDKFVYSDGTIFRFSNIGVDENGNLNLTTNPEKTDSTTDTTVPTIGWVNDPNASTNVVHRTGDEYIYGTKTFNGELRRGTPGATSGNIGLDVPTTGWVNDPNLSQNVVHRTGDEAIKGTKTFNIIRLMSDSIDNTTSPSSTQYASYMIQDKNQRQLGNFYISQSSDRNITANMIATNLRTAGVPSTNYDAAIRITAKVGGNIETYAPTPATNSNDNNIATTGWVTSLVNSKMQSSSAGFPNYNNLLKDGFNQGETYIMPKNGFLIATSWGNYATFQVMINGSYEFGIGGDFAKYHESETMTIPAPVGTTLYCTFLRGSNTIKIFGAY